MTNLEIFDFVKITYHSTNTIYYGYVFDPKIPSVIFTHKDNKDYNGWCYLDSPNISTVEIRRWPNLATYQLTEIPSMFKHGKFVWTNKQVELTIDQIAEKFGVDPSQLKIKK